MLKKICNIITTVVVILTVILAVLLGGVRLIGYTPFAILSPSMSPKYQPGDLVYVCKTEPENIKVGDVMTFMGGKDLIVTHRVAEIDSENRCIYTKGDANAIRDASPVLYENVIGVVKFSIPKLGYLSDFISSKKGKYTMLMVFCALIIVFLLPEMFGKEKNEEKKPGFSPEHNKIK